MNIKKDNMTVTDKDNNLVETKDGITCGCEKPSLKMVLHWDGDKEYGYTYNCTCGNVITTTQKRAEIDMWY